MYIYTFSQIHQAFKPPEDHHHFSTKFEHVKVQHLHDWRAGETWKVGWEEKMLENIISKTKCLW